MSKRPVVEDMMKQHGMRQREAERAFDQTLGSINSVLNRGGKVRTPFGTMERVETKARKGRNPRTGEEISIPARERTVIRPPRAR